MDFEFYRAIFSWGFLSFLVIFGAYCFFRNCKNFRMSDLNLIDLVFSDVFCEIKEVRIDFLSENIESSFK